MSNRMEHIKFLQLKPDENGIMEVRPLSVPHMAEVILDRNGRAIKNRFGPSYTPTWRNLFRDLRTLMRRKK